ncbi:ATP synthase [Alicyclobacillus tengchongensis]|nr:ATP synthase [Alicyclobacillus tengchongensis]
MPPMWTLLEAVTEQLSARRLLRLEGSVTKLVGMAIEATGPRTSLGDLCIVHGGERPCLAEVAGFRDDKLLLVPLSEIASIAPGASVTYLQRQLAVACGQGLLGRVLNGLGEPDDGQGAIAGHVTYRPVWGRPVHPLRRRRIEHVLATGVRAIDALLTLGEGQRVGVFAGSGVGKSTLLSMIARGSEADVNVIALVGERGREVREFIERDLGEEGLARSVVIVATSDQPAYIRMKAAFVATAIAEHFRDIGKRVAFMMDSITRFAMAQREVGLAAGEPPSSRGYTPSVFALLPQLLERTGPGETGAITAFYTVLVEGDDMNDPIADAVRGILDGHVVLSRRLANAGHYPAIDILASISRLFSTVASSDHQRQARRVRNWLSRYQEVEDLLRIGAYRSGTDAEVDIAIEKMAAIRALLEQEADEHTPFAETMTRLAALTGGAP